MYRRARHLLLTGVRRITVHLRTETYTRAAGSNPLRAVVTASWPVRWGLPAPRPYITQNGWAVNVLTETGVPGRGWMNWVRIWVPAYNQGAVFSPYCITIQWDSGKIWRRDDGRGRRRGRR
jgi:hypothetical protein